MTRLQQSTFTFDAAGVPGYGFVRLSQLAIEHLLKAR